MVANRLHIDMDYQDGMLGAQVTPPRQVRGCHDCGNDSLTLLERVQDRLQAGPFCHLNANTQGFYAGDIGKGRAQPGAGGKLCS